MKTRYIEDIDVSQMKTINCDVLVLGSGIAGLSTALNIAQQYKVIIISKAVIDQNNSNLAQGGIAACVHPEDDFALHIEDTLRAGAYYNKVETTKVLIEEAPKSIEKLLSYGANLDRDEKGQLRVTREGGHSKRRILHAKDATGREVVRALGQAIKERENIVLKEHVFAIDILTVKDMATGIVAINEDGEKIIYQSKAVVMATGGVGQLYKNTTNAIIATGDGIAMAYRAGASLKDMEFIQFHPTALHSDQSGQRFLISEAVRGEGAVLRNNKGQAFMHKYHEMKDLAPRDIVTRSIFTEMIASNSKHVYLDITHKPASFITERFPTIYGRCLEEGIDMTKQWIPVVPTEHYTMGGISTDVNGQTNIKGLYACGECACTGVHGANRLASNSLLEGLVFGNRVAQSMNEYLKKTIVKQGCVVSISRHHQENRASVKVEQCKVALQNIMDQYVSIVRSEEGLKKALKAVEQLRSSLWSKNKRDIPYYEAINMYTVAALIIRGALKRKESLGAHYRVEQMEENKCIINF
ncbi:L-aspartate oxidase [Clostridiaceae bacterium 35-E11]